MIDKEELQKAVDERNEAKLFHLFKQLSGMMGYNGMEFEDWRTIAVEHAFAKLHLYNKDRGEAYSFFYRVIQMRLAWEYRRSKTSSDSKIIRSKLDDSLGYKMEIDKGQMLIEIGGHLFDRVEISRAYRGLEGLSKTKKIRAFEKYIKGVIDDKQGKDKV